MLIIHHTQSLTPHETNEIKEHLSRVSRAGLCDITVVHGVAATVASWIKLASKTERLAFYTKVFCGVKRPNSYQTCGIAARTVAAVRTVGKGALLAAFLIALLKTNSREAPSIWTNTQRQTRFSAKNNSPFSLHSHTPLPPLQSRYHILLARTAARRSQQSVRSRAVPRVTHDCCGT